MILVQPVVAKRFAGASRRRCLSTSTPMSPFLTSLSDLSSFGPSPVHVRAVGRVCRRADRKVSKVAYPSCRALVIASHSDRGQNRHFSVSYKYCAKDHHNHLFKYSQNYYDNIFAESRTRPQERRRNFSSTKDQAPNPVPAMSISNSTDNDKSNETTNPLKDEATDGYRQIMEPDFESYLSGELDVPLEERKRRLLGDDLLPSSASSSDTTIVPPLEAATALTSNADAVTRKKRRRRVLIDPDKELYKQIERMQTIKKEKIRVKTATNVYRALWGNVIICVSKLGAWASSGSSAMLAEFIHSVVDCGNQALLLIGLRDSKLAADRKHPYGYGKSVYFWALVSALGTFFLGAGVSMTHAIGDLMNPALQEITWQVWGVLALSFIVDGYVLSRTISEGLENRPKNVSIWKHFSSMRDPATLAILLEDGAACLGVVLAFGGIAASHATGNPIFDGLAGVGISTLLGLMGLALVRVNHRFLLGQGVDREITDDIEKILLSRRSIDSIKSVQSQWTGPDTFSYKAEVDFDGTFLAAKLMPIYQKEFLQIRDTMDEELQVLLSLYAEDVMRSVEREVRHVEAQIRKAHPEAEFIELEPMSMDVDRLAIDDNLEAELRRVESDALNRYLKTLKKEGATVSDQVQPMADKKS